MRQLENLTVLLKSYPYRRRLTNVAVFLTITTIIALYHRSNPVSLPNGFAIGGMFILAMLCSPKGRPFRLFLGLAVGQIIGVVAAVFLSVSGGK